LEEANGALVDRPFGASLLMAGGGRAVVAAALLGEAFALTLQDKNRCEAGRKDGAPPLVCPHESSICIHINVCRYTYVYI